MRQFFVAQPRALLEAERAQPTLQLVEAHRQGVFEVHVAPLQEILRVVAEELQITLEQAVAAAELVRIRDRLTVPVNMSGHVHQRLARDRKHCCALCVCDQCRTVFRKCAAPAAVGFGIDDIADAQFEDPRDWQTIALELRPDETGFLARDGDDHVDRERRSHQRGQDACLKTQLEPADIVAGGHEDLLLQRRFRRRMPSAIKATGRGCSRAAIER